MCVGHFFFYIRHTSTKFELNLQSERYQTGTNYSTWEGLGTNTGVKEKRMEQERSNQPSKTSSHNSHNEINAGSRTGDDIAYLCYIYKLW